MVSARRGALTGISSVTDLPEARVVASTSPKSTEKRTGRVRVEIASTGRMLRTVAVTSGPCVKRAVMPSPSLSAGTSLTGMSTSISSVDVSRSVATRWPRAI